tara:strand:- start:9611 stop:10504 length:894 start_codon:yes stop_codon:yes gene_type:complete
MNAFSPIARRFGRGAIALQAQRGEALSFEQISQFAPTVFAENAHSSRSERFQVIPTHQLLGGLAKEGFLPVKVQVGGSRDQEKRAFTKHLIRFRRQDDLAGTPKVGDSHPEVVLLNAHDGTSSYQLHAGLFRLVCLNGLTVSDANFGQIKVGHSGRSVLDKVIDGTYRVLDDAVLALEQAQELRGVELSRDEQRIFGEAALRIRFDDETLPNIPGREVVRVRRDADAYSTLWHTFNRAQENLIRGGLNYRHTNEETNRVSYRETRPVQNADGDLKLNRALWHLTQEFAKLKGQAVAA